MASYKLNNRNARRGNKKIRKIVVTNKINSNNNNNNHSNNIEFDNKDLFPLNSENNKEKKLGLQIKTFWQIEYYFFFVFYFFFCFCVFLFFGMF